MPCGGFCPEESTEIMCSKKIVRAIRSISGADRGGRQLLAFMGAAFSLFLGGCDIVNQPVILQRKIPMDITSNVPDTAFRYRTQRIDADPEEGWQDAGSGMKVTVRLCAGGRYEIAAKPKGYAEKRDTLSEPIPRYEFKFVAADREPGPPLVVAEVACDLRIVRVFDAKVMCGASEKSARVELEGLAAGLAAKLKQGMPVEGESLAVVTLRNRSGTIKGREVADEVADKVTNALSATSWFDVKERIRLGDIVREIDLETAGIVYLSDVKPRLVGVKFIVMGGVTVLGSGNSP